MSSNTKDEQKVVKVLKVLGGDKSITDSLSLSIGHLGLVCSFFFDSCTF